MPRRGAKHWAQKMTKHGVSCQQRWAIGGCYIWAAQDSGFYNKAVWFSKSRNNALSPPQVMEDSYIPYSARFLVTQDDEFQLCGVEVGEPQTCRTPAPGNRKPDWKQVGHVQSLLSSVWNCSLRGGHWPKMAKAHWGLATQSWAWSENLNGYPNGYPFGILVIQHANGKSMDVILVWNDLEIGLSITGFAYQKDPDSTQNDPLPFEQPKFVR
jgi:hypothetical protein